MKQRGALLQIRWKFAKQISQLQSAYCILLYRVADSVFIVAGDHHDNLAFWTSVDLLKRLVKDRLVHGRRCVK